LLRCAAAVSGLFGSMLPGSTACRAVDEGFPPVTWWRTGARTGIAAAEACANITGTLPAPQPRPAAADSGPLTGGSPFRPDDRDLSIRTTVVTVPGTAPGAGSPWVKSADGGEFGRRTVAGTGARV
jgi:hypothetical protein